LPKDGKEKITIKDLLNMRSGLDANDEDPSTPGDEDNLDAIFRSPHETWQQSAS
jgi:CubicO group peptidase (beta-lactamase class C family)